MDELNEYYVGTGKKYIIIGIIELFLSGLFFGIPVIVLGAVGREDAKNQRYPEADKVYLIAKIISGIGAGYFFLRFMALVYVLTWLE